MIGIDLGGTNVRAAVVSPEGRILCSRRTTTKINQGVSSLFDRLEKLCRDLIHESGVGCSAIGIGIPGILGQGGIIRVSPNLPQLNGVNLAKILTDRLGCPVFPVNDADAIAWGEGRFGAGLPFSSFVMVTLGTGVGGGIVLDQALWQGHPDGVAGEIGHMTVEPDGRLCGCGNRGCLETYASAEGIVRSVKEALAQGAASSLARLDEEALTSATIAAAAHAGDAVALAAFETAGCKLGTALAGVINLINPDAIIFAGGATKSFDLLQPYIVQELSARSFVYMRRRIPLIVCRLGDDAGILGAADLAARALAFSSRDIIVTRHEVPSITANRSRRRPSYMANQEELSARELYRLIIYNSPEDILDEVAEFLGDYLTEDDQRSLKTCFSVATRLYRGEWPGYQPCNTEYHNLFHATHTFLALARLIHGARLEQITFESRQLLVALSVAIFHDAGYLQETGDTGSGAKYTREHVARGIHLFRSLAAEWGFVAAELDSAERLFWATDLAVTCVTIEFSSENEQLLALLLDGADLTTQMSDRTYLEKLLFLYHEFREAGIDFYDSEADLLRKTVGFYEMIEQRLAAIAPRMDLFWRVHFRFRCGLAINPYQESIRRQKLYLQQIVRIPDSDPREFLKRDGIVTKVRNRYK